MFWDAFTYLSLISDQTIKFYITINQLQSKDTVESYTMQQQTAS